MASPKLIAAYPQPKDFDAFDEVYQKDHVPMAIANLAGKTKIFTTKVSAASQGKPGVLLHCRGSLSFHRSAPAMR